MQNTALVLFAGNIRAINNNPGDPYLFNCGGYDNAIYDIDEDGRLIKSDFNYKDPVDLKLNCSLSDIPAVKRELPK